MNGLRPFLGFWVSMFLVSMGFARFWVSKFLWALPVSGFLSFWVSKFLSFWFLSLAYAELKVNFVEGFAVLSLRMFLGF